MIYLIVAAATFGVMYGLDKLFPKCSGARHSTIPAPPSG